jgi:CheY-like chemotaxis protein/HPt (histidine-containing phosphotransfer) domain-containing protein
MKSHSVKTPDLQIDMAEGEKLILVVDDNDINRKLLRLYLMDMGHRVLISNDGYSALSTLQTEAIDLIFLDLHMPVMNGCETSRAIRQLQGRYQEIPIIGLSADGLPDSLQKALNAGMNEYLVKPIRQEDLQRILEKWLPFARHGKRKSAVTIASKVRDLQLMLVKEMPDYSHRLKRALDIEDYEEIYDVAHRIVGGSAYCDLPELNGIAQQLQTAARHSETAQTHQHAASLLSHIDRLLKELPAGGHG